MKHKFTPRKRVQVESFEMSFEYKNHPGAGYGFECNSAGVIKTALMNPEGIKSLEFCMAGGDESDPILPGKLRDCSYSYMANGSCECPRCHVKVWLSDAFWNTCDNCGADFDGNGNMLAPREQWGEETGECLADIMSGAEAEY